jgi:hypothetical protein
MREIEHWMNISWTDNLSESDLWFFHANELQKPVLYLVEEQTRSKKKKCQLHVLVWYGVVSFLNNGPNQVWIKRARKTNFAEVRRQGVGE